jgi:hypothetical protein
VTIHQRKLHDNAGASQAALSNKYYDEIMYTAVLGHVAGLHVAGLTSVCKVSVKSSRVEKPILKT